MIIEIINSLISYGIGCLVDLSLSNIAFGVLFIVIWIKVVKPVVKNYTLAKKLEKLAGNPKPHWFYGHLKQLGSNNHEIIMTMSKLWSINPLMYNVWRGPIMSILHVYHPDTVKAILLSGAPKDWLVYGFFRDWLGDGLITSKGEQWKRHRTMLTQTFHFAILKNYMEKSNRASLVLIKKWKNLLNEPLEISKDVGLMTLDTMIQCSMSTETDCQLSQAKNLYTTALDDVARAIMLRALKPIHYLKWIYMFTPEGRKFYKDLKVVHSHSKKIIADRRKALGENFLPVEISKKKKSNLDFIDILLRTQDEDGNRLSDEEILDEVNTFMFAGHDTTSSGLEWTIYNLAKYPEMQEKCREEVQFICRDQEEVEWEDLNRMTYLTMFLKESLRLFPPTVIVSRCLEKPIHVKSDLLPEGECIFPAGASINFNILALHRHPDFWEDALVFNPDRFSSENCASRNSFSYAPFSAGSRNCIGQNFAMNEMKVALTHILTNFRLYLDHETPEPVFEARLILQSKDGIFVKLDALEED